MSALLPLLQRLERAGLVLGKQGRFRHIEVDHLANDSRKVGPGGLFVAITGERFDGSLFIDKAVQNGAVAIVCEAMPGEVRSRFPGIAFIRVADARAALAELAAAFFEDPSKALRLVGVTGTNGKTTTAFLVHHLLNTLGERAGLIGTIAYQFGGTPAPATLTTPDSLPLNAMLRQMVDTGHKACAMEVSSHALAQGRVRALEYDVAVFTNITHDHLDYHETDEAYLAAKADVASVLEFGAGCAGTAGTPLLRAVSGSRPVQGGTFSLLQPAFTICGSAALASAGLPVESRRFDQLLRQAVQLADRFARRFGAPPAGAGGL